jgi:hypothetical protein
MVQRSFTGLITAVRNMKRRFLPIMRSQLAPAITCYLKDSFSHKQLVFQCNDPGFYRGFFCLPYRVLSFPAAQEYVCYLDLNDNEYFMKSFLTLLVSFIMAASFVAIPEKSNAQILKTLTPEAANDTLTNTDTAWVYISAGLGSSSSSLIESNAISVEALVTKISGTVAGTVALEGNIDGTNWKAIGSADALTNTATQLFVYNLRNSTGHLQYRQYRLVFITSGTNSVIPKAYYLRRSN